MASASQTTIPDNTPLKSALETPVQGTNRGLSDQIRQVIQADPSQSAQIDYQRRMRAAQGLGIHLTDEEVQALLAFLRTPPSADVTLDLLSINSIKNEVMDLLIQQEPLPPDLGKELALMADDPSLDSGLRDYCVQHFAPYFKARWGDGEVDPESPDYQAIMLGYDQAVRQTNPSLAGTALIGLYSLSEDYQAVDRQNVEKLAFQMGNDPGTFVNTRVTAMQLCGRMGLKEILPAARMEAQSGETIQLRMSANDEDRAFAEIDNAVENRGVTAVAVIGYSHGGGSTYRISDRMDDDATVFNLAFTAYVDAITQPFANATAEDRRPVGSTFHVNYYQVAQWNDAPLFLDGTPSTPAGAGFEDNVDDPTVTESHTTIDDAQVVQDGIRTRLFQQVNR